MPRRTKRRYDDELDAAPAHDPTKWSPELVGERLVEAFQVLARLPNQGGPRGTTSIWPEFYREFEEREAAQALADTDPRKPRTKVRPTPEQIGAWLCSRGGWV
jgi:hypothetical protein